MIRLLLLATVAIAVFALRGRPGPTIASRIGRLLRGMRCGDARLTSNDPVLHALPHFELHSDGFVDGEPMQAAYAGANGQLPPLTWSGEPPAAVELALIVEDIDVPFPAPLVHAIAYGIDPTRHALPAGAIPTPVRNDGKDPAITPGRGTGGRRFLPPTPIPGHGPHRYVFQLFAVGQPLAFDRPPNKARLLSTLRETAIARAVITATHENP